MTAASLKAAPSKKVASNSIEKAVKATPVVIDEAPLVPVVEFYQNIKWDQVRTTCRKGVNNTGLVIATIGTVLNDFGTFLKGI